MHNKRVLNYILVSLIIANLALFSVLMLQDGPREKLLDTCKNYLEVNEKLKKKTKRKLTEPERSATLEKLEETKMKIKKARTILKNSINATQQQEVTQILYKVGVFQLKLSIALMNVKPGATI